MAQRGRLKGEIAQWQKRTDDHQEKQLVNPFSDWEGASHQAKLSKDDVNYGRPVEGSKTESRGKKAGELVNGEITELCSVIRDLGNQQSDGTYTVSFRDLFDTYTRISSKLVGMLMRARKQNLVAFEGEMLFQRRDDHVIISLLKHPECLTENHRS